MGHRRNARGKIDPRAFRHAVRESVAWRNALPSGDEQASK
jgi:hypothetical protein